MTAGGFPHDPRSIFALLGVRADQACETADPEDMRSALDGFRRMCLFMLGKERGEIMLESDLVHGTEFAPAQGARFIDRISLDTDAIMGAEFCDFIAAVRLDSCPEEVIEGRIKAVLRLILWVTSLFDSGFRYSEVRVDAALAAQEAPYEMHGLIIQWKYLTPLGLLQNGQEPQVEIYITNNDYWSPKWVQGFQDMLSGFAMVHGIHVSIDF